MDKENKKPKKGHFPKVKLQDYKTGPYITNSFTDFIQVHPDTLKKRNDINFTGEVLFTIKAKQHKDFLTLQKFIRINPYAFTSFFESGLIEPFLSKWNISIKGSRKAPRAVSLMKCLRLQAALLYGFFRYCEKNEEYPNCVQNLESFEQFKRAYSLNPAQSTALFMKYTYKTLIKKIKLKASFFDIEDMNIKKSNFMVNIIQAGQAMLKKDFRNSLKYLCEFTSWVLIHHLFDDKKLFPVIYHINKTFDEEYQSDNNPALMLNNFKDVQDIEVTTRNAFHSIS
jgi:hypothetical protein